jgi:UDP-N-acetylglucosamine 2-epimerase
MEDQKEEIRQLIRKGMKTSEIINLGKYPIDIVKRVKSEEIANDAKIKRELEKENQMRYIEGKQKKAHESFLRRIGQSIGHIAENTNEG